MNETTYNHSYNNTPVADNGSIAIGVLLGLSTIPGITGNLIIALLIVYGNLMAHNKPVIYKMILNLSLSDALQLLGSLAYLSPSIATQDWLVSWGWQVAFGSYFLMVYYANISVVCLISVNRYFAICKGSGEEIPTHKQTTIINVIIWPIAAIVAGLLNSFAPYKFMYDYQVYSYAYIGCCGEDLRAYVFEIPMDIVISLIQIFCYSSIFYHIRRSGREVEHIDASAKRQKRRRRELRLAVQFSVISLVFILMWVFFYFFPVLLRRAALKAYVVIAFLVVANSTVNAGINLCFNEDLRAIMKARFRREPCSVTTEMQRNNKASLSPNVG